jgi:hypothetical protein
MVMRIRRSITGKATEGWRKLHNENFIICNIRQIIKSDFITFENHPRHLGVHKRITIITDLEQIRFWGCGLVSGYVSHSLGSAEVSWRGLDRDGVGNRSWNEKIYKLIYSNSHHNWKYWPTVQHMAWRGFTYTTLVHRGTHSPKLLLSASRPFQKNKHSNVQGY